MPKLGSGDQIDACLGSSEPNAHRVRHTFIRSQHKDWKIRRYTAFLSIAGASLLVACGSSGNDVSRFGPNDMDVPEGIFVGRQMQAAGATRLSLENGQFLFGDISLLAEFLDQDRLQVTANSGDTSLATNVILIRNDGIGTSQFLNPNDEGMRLSFANPVTEAALAGRYASLATLYIPGEDPGSEDRVMVILGAEASDLPLSGTANYDGGVALYRSTMGSDEVDYLEGVLELEANFATGFVSGEMMFDTDKVVRLALVDPEGNLAGNGFTAGLGSGTAGYTVTDGRMDGKFYGPNAEEVGGSFEFNYDDSTLEQTGSVSGVFLGKDD